jgi:hypothetical protein
MAAWISRQPFQKGNNEGYAFGGAQEGIFDLVLCAQSSKLKMQENTALSLSTGHL